MSRRRRRMLRHLDGGVSVMAKSEGGSFLTLWMLRFLLHSNWAFQSFYTQKHGFSDTDLQDFLGLQDVEDGADCKYVKQCLQALLEGKEEVQTSDSSVFRNIDMLGQRVGLNDIEKMILFYAVLVEETDLWRDLFRSCPIRTSKQLMQVIAVMLDIAYQDVRTALSGKASLRSSGLVNLSKHRLEDGRLGMMDDLTEVLQGEYDSEEELLQCFLLASSAPTLQMQDYPHVAEDITVLHNLLQAAGKLRDKGVNILIYGTPGSGKTELCRLLADQLGFSLFEVKTADEDGDPIRPQMRLEHYRLCQQLLAKNTQSLLLFDEVEDVFPARSFSFFGEEIRSGENKGWLNKMLEENPVPSLWVCNRVSQIDAAFIRRFDYVLELNTPPKAVRLRIIDQHLSDLPISEELKQSLAEHAQVSPALVAKLGKVLSRMQEKATDGMLLRMVNNSLKAMQYPSLKFAKQGGVAYDLSFLNTSLDIPDLIAGLQRNRRGNLCFYGAPGTGKTALAAHIARTLDMPLLSKRASDILGMYVGQSEKNIADMFAEAKQDKALLVLDEADSLLRDRRGANHSWEVTQVNELLVQMENFEGIFICSTNLMENLDQAALRRFAIKTRFDYLRPEQALRMLKQVCTDEVKDAHHRALNRLHCLAPGDFSAVFKRLTLLGTDITADAVIQGLQEEVAVKSEDGARKTIGF